VEGGTGGALLEGATGGAAEVSVGAGVCRKIASVGVGVGCRVGETVGPAVGTIGPELAVGVLVGCLAGAFVLVVGERLPGPIATGATVGPEPAVGVVVGLKEGAPALAVGPLVAAEVGMAVVGAFVSGVLVLGVGIEVGRKVVGAPAAVGE
jgi:hypothetical protein